MPDPKKTHGGAREGAGRPRKAPETLALVLPTQSTPQAEAVAFLRAVMASPEADMRLRIDAAKALLKSAPAAPQGIKASAQAAALAASSGRYGMRPAPTGAGIKDQRQRDALAPSGTGWDDLLDPDAMPQ